MMRSLNSPAQNWQVALRVSLTQATTAVRPPPALTISQWADECLQLSAEDSAEPGRFATDRAPYQRGILDALSEPGIHTVVVMSSAQIGKTVLLKAIIGYHVDQDPAPILMLQPTEAMAEAFSKDRLAPMIRDTPVLRDKIADPRARDSGNTILHKRFTGGHLTLVGANSAAGLASRPIRVVLCDEVDRYPASAGAEGDPVNLAIKRAATFWNRRIVLTSTPSIKGVSRIERAFNLSDQRRYYVPCPHCREFHPWRWADLHFDSNNPALNPVMACPDCGGIIEERHKPRLLALGEWRSDNPTVRGVAGFHLNELYSPWRKWSEVVADFLAAKGAAETLKVWVNTSLGECWEEETEKQDADSLLLRRENYDATALPDGILYLTAGVDVQADRLEVEIVGWRQDGQDVPAESWGVEYHAIPGDPAKVEVWDSLDAVLQSTWTTQSGRRLRVMAVGVDSGGHHTAQVYAYCAARKGQYFYACKGVDGPRPIWSGKKSRSPKYKAELWLIGSDTGKDAWYSRLKIAEPGPGYCHFPLGYDRHYFSMLTAEQVRTKYRKGRAVREWFLPAHRRNEALDIRVLALAVLMARPVNWQALGNTPLRPVATAAPRAAQRDGGSSFVNRPSGLPWTR